MDNNRCTLSFLIPISALTHFGAFLQESFLPPKDLSLIQVNNLSHKVIAVVLLPHSHSLTGLLITKAAESSSTEGGDNVILLSQRYNEEEFSNEIVGEVENNRTEPVEIAKVTTTVYDSGGGTVGTRPGMNAPFKILLLDSPLEDSETYEFLR